MSFRIRIGTAKPLIAAAALAFAIPALADGAAPVQGTASSPSVTVSAPVKAATQTTAAVTAPAVSAPTVAAPVVAAPATAAPAAVTPAPKPVVQSADTATKAPEAVKTDVKADEVKKSSDASTSVTGTSGSSSDAKAKIASSETKPVKHHRKAAKAVTTESAKPADAGATAATGK